MPSGRLNFIVKRAFPSDARDLCVRINIHDRPKGIEWDDWVTLTLADTGKHVVCRIRGDNRLFGPVDLHCIHINPHLRDMLGYKWDELAGYRLDEFHLQKAPPWLFPLYVLRYHPDDGKRAQVLIPVVLGTLTLLSGIAISVVKFLIS